VEGDGFPDRLRNLKVTNVSTQLASRELWEEDGVHLTAQGYAIVARHILQGIVGLEARRLPGDDDLDQLPGAKRAGRGELTGSEIPKRQVTNSGFYVERQEQFRGRGGHSEDDLFWAEAGPGVQDATTSTEACLLSFQKQ
jgi:hypothetical protein